MMSHPDPCYDPYNSYEDDHMATNYSDYHYDYHDAFYGEDSASYHPDADHEVASQFDEEEEENEEWSDDYNDSMDGDHESGLASAGWGLDESYDPSYDHDDYDHGGDW
jgi:hypothetical protein